LLPCPKDSQQVQTVTPASTKTQTQPEVTTTPEEYDKIYENRLYKEFKYMMPEEPLNPEEYEVIKNADERLGQAESTYLACNDAASVKFESCFNGCLDIENTNPNCNTCMPKWEQENGQCYKVYKEQTDQVDIDVQNALADIEKTGETPAEQQEPEDELAKFQREYGINNLMRDGNNWHLDGCSGCVLQGDRLLTSDPEHIWFNGVGLSTGGEASIRLIQDDANKQVIAYERGTVHLRYTPGTKKYEVQAGGVKIGITGTEFLLTEQDNSTFLLLKQGSLELDTSQGKKTMAAGQQAVISGGKAVITTADASEMKEMMEPFKIVDSGKKYILWICLIFFIMPFIVQIYLNNFLKKKYSSKGTGITHYGIAGFVLSIFGLLFAILGPVGWFFGYLALSFSKLQKDINPTGLAKAGYIIGIIGCILSSVILIPLLIYALVP
jgi:hypothetical protein